MRFGHAWRVVIGLLIGALIVANTLNIAADLVAVEADHLLAELTQPDRGVVAARSGADDQCVDGLRSHEL